jgi:Zn ribbon nucleic-acid-binding protein
MIVQVAREGTIDILEVSRMARNTIVAGPSRWDIMLALFDDHPAASHGTRTVSFKLKNGLNISAEIHWATRPSRHDDYTTYWKLIGSSTSMPHGYYYSQGNLEFHYDPIRHNGYVDLELSCPDCGSPETTHASRDDDTRHVITCTACGHDFAELQKGFWTWIDSEIVRQESRFHGSLKVRILQDDPMQ